MNSRYFGNIEFTIFGASHADEIGVVIDGLPLGFAPDFAELNAFLQRRAPGRSEFCTERKEADIPEFTQGIKNGKVCGTVRAVIKNTDRKPGDYAALKAKPRPGHADYTARVKYGADFDMTGGGHFSGRMTAPLCIVGGLCLQLLQQKGITVAARIVEIGGAQDADEMRSAIQKAKTEGDSLGGIIECVAEGVPAGLGDAMFDGMEGRIAKLVFGIPAVKGVEFGAGFRAARLRGSENNDAFAYVDGRVCTKTNHCGGILGGITDGMPLVMRTVVKPTPSIAKPQDTVNFETGENDTLCVAGRHDPCIVPRALPCMEAAMAIAVYDALCGQKSDKNDLSELRQEIDKIDRDMVRLFAERMAVSEKIAAYKAANGLPIMDTVREGEKLREVAGRLPEELRGYGEELYKTLFALSRDRQNKLMAAKRKCGLLGRRLGHSYSPQIHAMLADYEYKLYEKEPEELEDFLRNGGFDGLNVTIPYKKAVMPYCDELSETARSIGSVNTLVRRPDGTLYGDNTDAFGFESLVHKSGISVVGKKVLILGSGGASATVCAVLRTLGAGEITVISRSGENNYANLARHADAQVIVNTTPVGMYPHNGESLIDLSSFAHCEGVLDVVYNPERTALTLQAEALGIPHANGLYMLVAQAKRSSEQFTGMEIPDSEIERIETVLRAQMRNIVLIGMPGSGKTTIAELLGEKLGRPALDADSELVSRTGRSIPEIFASYGEEHFRRLETAGLADLGKLSGRIIATGGGCVTREENYAHLHQNAVIVWIERDIMRLAREGRPLSEGADLREMYTKRRACYERFADLRIDNNGTPEETVACIMEAIQ